MRLYGSLLVIEIFAQTAWSFVVPHQHHLAPRRFSPSRPFSPVVMSMAEESSSDGKSSSSIDELQQEIDAVLKERERRRRELEQEVLTFQDQFQSVKTNIRAADSRLKNETRVFQEKLERQKATLESVDASILEKMQQLESLKEESAKQSNVFSLENTLVPFLALGVAALVVVRQRSLEEEIDRIREEAEAEVRQDLTQAKQQPQYAIAVRHAAKMPRCCVCMHLLTFRLSSCFVI